MPPENDPNQMPGADDSNVPSMEDNSVAQQDWQSAQLERADPDATVRRTRPAPMSMGSSRYGTMELQPPGQGPAEAYSQSTSAQEQTRENMRTPELPALQRFLSPEATQQAKQKKPAMPRRASSRYQGPHRGQEFSVDDDPDEYASEQIQRQSSSAKVASGYGPALRRQPSTLKRRQTGPPPFLARVDSRGDEEREAEFQDVAKSATLPPISAAEEAGEDQEEEGTEHADDEDEVEGIDEDDLSDAESFTLKDRQQAINETHPFGIRIWKPALYKKNRSVEKTAEGDIHSSPGGRVDKWLWLFNVLWTIMFGWWLGLATFCGAVLCFAFGLAPEAADYGRVLLGLAGYLLYPFGKFVKLEQDETYAEEDEGEGRSITEYEQWQSGDLEDGRLFFGPLSSRGIVGRSRDSMDSADENDSLLGHSRTGGPQQEEGARSKRRLFGRGQWTFGRVIFFVCFYFGIAPLMLLVSGMCFFLVFWIPMGKVTLLLFSHLRRHPLALSFHSDAAYSRAPSTQSSSILLCTYRAVGLKYWKYTIDGTNIFLINLIGVVLFAIFDYWVLDVALGLDTWLVHPGFVFALALFSIIPLAYFIGQAVASISAQSSMGVGAAINAFFSTVVEVFLYCVALNQGKGQLVEGSVIGSIFAGVLFLPGLSMCFGAINRKTQRFNVKSAGVTSTMLLFAVIAAFGPTLFYQIYGSHELNCSACIVTNGTVVPHSECKRCFFSQIPALNDRFFVEAVRPYCWFAAVMLFLSYIIGLWFTLRTHAAVIWNNELDEKKLQGPPAPDNASIRIPGGAHTAANRQHSGSTSGNANRNAIRDTQLYKRILGQSLKQVGLSALPNDEHNALSTSAEIGSPHAASTTFMVPPKNNENDSNTAETASLIEGLSEEQNEHLVRQVAEMAATAATVAARDVARAPRKVQAIARAPAHMTKQRSRAPTIHEGVDDIIATEIIAGGEAGGGHDAPNWSRTKSAVILLGATVLYAVIAEILVNTVDVVLESVDIDEKFLGITLFALVPNTTEFLNAISFAMNGNIALSMEIGSAYALQVCMLQIPALVLFSAVHGRFIDPSQLMDHTFNLLFPQWDMVTVILCVFLLSYVYGEGKSNYFKGSILVLTYLVIVMGFYLSGLSNGMETNGIDRFEIMGAGSVETFKTIGRGRSGQAYSFPA